MATGAIHRHQVFVPNVDARLASVLVNVSTWSQSARVVCNTVMPGVCAPDNRLKAVEVDPSEDMRRLTLCRQAITPPLIAALDGAAEASL